MVNVGSNVIEDHVMDVYLVCKYIGKDKLYTKNKNYVLKVQQKWFGSWLKVAPVHGYFYMPVHGLEKTYDNLEHFLEEWQFKKFEKDEQPWMAKELATNEQDS